MNALLFATQLLQSLPGLIAAGVEVVDLIQKGNAKLKELQAEGRDPTPEEWDDLNDSIDEKRRRLHD